MSRKVLSTFLSVAFLLSVIMPTILIVVDNDADISMFFSVSEEEEGNENENESESELDREYLAYTVKIKNSDIAFVLIENNLEYFYKEYSKPHLIAVSPPPELHLL